MWIVLTGKLSGKLYAVRGEGSRDQRGREGWEGNLGDGRRTDLEVPATKGISLRSEFREGLKDSLGGEGHVMLVHPHAFGFHGDGRLVARSDHYSTQINRLASDVHSPYLLITLQNCGTRVGRRQFRS